MTRPQFSIRTLFWLTLCVAMFFGGMIAQHRLAGFRATEREKKQDIIIGLLRKQLQLRLQESSVYRDRELELLLKLEKARKVRP